VLYYEVTKVSCPHFDFHATLHEVAEICGGRTQECWADVVVHGVSTDSRNLARGELFVALAGQRHNGHEFLDAARQAGAAAAVVTRADLAPDGLPVVVVTDTLRALGKIAAWHRSRLPARVAAITGSTGKTTTKDMLGAIMAQVGPVVVAEGTQNNEIGVPLTLLRLTREHKFCVLELAMRGPGEIDYLAAIAKPDVGIITNVGQSHVGRLGTREAIAQAKAELLGHLPPEGTAVLNADDFFFPVLSAMAPCPVVSFGTAPQAEVRADEIDDRSIDRVSFQLIAPVGTGRVTLPVPGRHNVMNALAATAAALQLGATFDGIVAVLERYEGADMRMQRMPGPRGSLIINDAYNASPDSVAAALAVLSAAPGRKIMIFGDMLEMGPEGEPAHRAVGEQVAAAGVRWLIAVGELAAVAAARARELGVRVDVVEDVPAAAALLRDELGSGDVVLVKGSRGMRLERVVEELTDDH